jgi:hypothetical protein
MYVVGFRARVWPLTPICTRTVTRKVTLADVVDGFPHMRSVSPIQHDRPVTSDYLFRNR